MGSLNEDVLILRGEGGPSTRLDEVSRGSSPGFKASEMFELEL
jgi:hypothetical protein